MTRCMPPMGHVVDLPDRQYPLGSSRGSCNKNITFTTHTVTTMSRNIYLGTYAFKYSRKYVLMYSSTPYSSTYYSCTHVLMHPVLCTYVPVYSVLMYSCTIPVNVRHSATATMSMTNISVRILYISNPVNNLKTCHTYSVSSSSSSR